MKNSVKKISFTLLGLFLIAPSLAVSKDPALVQFLELEDKSLPFSDAVRVGHTLFLSGQVGLDYKTGKLVTGGIEAETKQTLVNIETTLQAFGYAKSDVVKCTVMLTDINDFKQFNSAYKSFFSAPYPARTTFSVSDLPVENSTVEIECIAAKEQ